MESPRIALIHATPVAIEPIQAAFKRLWPEARTTNLLDDSLSSDLTTDGKVTDNMSARFIKLATYARETGAEAILFTCSAFGRAIEAASAKLDVPVLKPNEAMLEQALACGNRVGILATFGPSVPSLRAELEELARSKGVEIMIRTHVIHGAFAALHEGESAEHDRLIASAASDMEDCDAIVLGQFSMASAADRIPKRSDRKVITSPDSAVLRLKQVLGR